MGHFVYMPDPTDPPQRMELFGNCADVNSVPQVADALGVCAQTVRRLIASGELGCVHVGRAVRVTRQQMIDFVTRQEVRA